jgi:hypothetical protein
MARRWLWTRGLIFGTAGHAVPFSSNKQDNHGRVRQGRFASRAPDTRHCTRRCLDCFRSGRGSRWWIIQQQIKPESEASWRA